MIKQHTADLPSNPFTGALDFSADTPPGWVESDTSAVGLSPLSLDTAVKAAVAVPKPTPQPMALFLTESGDTAAISVNDIHQGQIGDCFLLSSIGELAAWHASSITGMIKANANGTETVTLYAGSNGQPAGFGATSFKAITETVTNSFASNGVNNGATQDVVGGVKEIWVQVMEKAVAQEDGGMAAISNGGNPCIALQELTGHTASWASPAAMSATSLAAALAKDMTNGSLVVMDTNSSGLSYGLVGSHAYMFEGISGSGASAAVKLGNPWGMDQPQLIPVANLARAGIVEIDTGHW